MHEEARCDDCFDQPSREDELWLHEEQVREEEDREEALLEEQLLAEETESDRFDEFHSEVEDYDEDGAEREPDEWDSE